MTAEAFTKARPFQAWEGDRTPPPSGGGTTSEFPCPTSPFLIQPQGVLTVDDPIAS